MLRKAANCLCALLLAPLFTMSGTALPFSADAFTYYTYTAEGTVVECPPAYTPVAVYAGKELGIADAFSPADVCAAADTVYVADTQANRVVVLDAELKVLSVIETLSGTDTPSFNQPEGVFADESGRIYVADTKNKRIVVCDRQGRVSREWRSPGIQVMGEEVDFFPSKLSVDKAGRMFVACGNINRGLVELDGDGRFAGFIGAPDVRVSLSDYFWKLISTAEQRKRMESFVPTEFNNVAIDGEGFLYATIGTLDTDAIRQFIRSDGSDASVTPIKRLNAAGEDILHRTGFFPPVGDLAFSSEEGPSLIADVAVRESGMYTLIDSKRQRAFTYDQDGNLLYIAGGSGSRDGAFQSLSSVAYVGDRLLFADRTAGRLTLMEPTAYGRCVNKAVELAYAGDFEQADAAWSRALGYNANLYMAYVGKGKAAYRQEKYREAMAYYRAVGETKNYGKAKRAYQEQLFRRYAPVVWIGGALLLLAITAAVIRKRVKRRAGGRNR